MIDVDKLHNDLVAQDTELREAFSYWTDAERLRLMPVLSQAEILAAGLLAIHERLGNIAEILAVKP